MIYKKLKPVSVTVTLDNYLLISSLIDRHLYHFPGLIGHSEHFKLQTQMCSIFFYAL